MARRLVLKTVLMVGARVATMSIKAKCLRELIIMIQTAKANVLVAMLKKTQSCMPLGMELVPTGRHFILLFLHVLGVQK